MLHTLVSKFSSILYISNFILKWPFPYVLNVLVALCDLSKKKKKWHYLNLCVEDMYTYESMFSDIQTGISVAYFAVGFFLSDELLIILGSWSWSCVDIITVFYLYFTALIVLYCIIYTSFYSATM
jgi:hypothetical protein